MNRERLKKSLLHILLPLVSAGLFVLALHVLFRELHAYHYREVLRYFQQLPTARIALAVGAGIMSYLMLTGYDVLGLRYAKHSLPYGRIAFTSFTGYAFSNSIGYSFLSGGAVRYRFYSAWGLSSLEIAKVIIFCFVTAMLGYFAVAGAAFSVTGQSIPSYLNLRLPVHTVRPLGFGFLALVALYLALSLFMKKPLRIRKMLFRFPGPSLALRQLAVSCLDWLFAAATLFLLFPSPASLPFFGFLIMYLLSQLAGSASQVPGGLGVFKMVMVLLLSKNIDQTQVIGALLSFRIIYYFTPLVLAGIMIGAYEFLHRMKNRRRAVSALAGRITALSPQIFALFVFFAGSILLFSGSIPSFHGRLQFLSGLLPLHVMEVSHFLGSIVGVSLILLAHGLQQRLNVAYYISVALLGAGIVLSLLRGMRYGEALALSIILAALIPTHRQFYRNAVLTRQRFSSEWILAVCFVVITSLWLGIFSYREVSYSGELWWHFSLKGDASRFLRASVCVAVVLLAAAAGRLLRPAAYRPVLPDSRQLRQAGAVAARSPDPNALLALLGDKMFLFSGSGRSFIMFGVRGRSWIALGNPVGPEEEWNTLLLEFRDVCDRYGGIPVFYEIDEEHAAMYRDLGLSLFKFGEEAWVRVHEYTLEGGERSGFRHTINQMRRHGWVFEVVESEKVPECVPELKKISDEWLARKGSGEKGFSLGFFNPDYLSVCPIAVLRNGNGISAFANILAGSGGDVFSIDVMRYGSNAPHNAMEYLFLQLILWGKQSGYTWFNLGMAPLSGLENDELSPVWDQIGTFIFRHGEHFYNFQGLRAFKEKFGPVWKPRYLALPGGLALPRVLMNAASLIKKGARVGAPQRKAPGDPKG
jgi:phosphatidylglycerol lysyltransferase